MLKYFEKIQKDFGFEKRSGQIKMANLVKDAIINDEKVVIEAGTGIGKTYAYLLPCIIDAKLNDKKVVISTNTINLQEQIVEKDLPFLEKVLGEKIEYCIVKGRSNYICGNRLQKNSTNDRLIEWYKKEKIGDKSSIDFKISNEEWQSVCGDADFCINFGCSKLDNCFFYKSRKALQNKNVLIVNHSLLFSSFKYEGLLPKYDTLILDEAHNIENIARSYFETRISSKEVFKNIGMLHNSQTKLGIVRRICTELTNLGANKEKMENLFIDYSDTINTLYEIYFSMINNLVKVLLQNKVYSVREIKIRKDLDKYKEYVSRINDKYILLLNHHNELVNYMEEFVVDENLNANYFMVYNKLSDNISSLIKIQDVKEEIAFNWFRYEYLSQDFSIISTPLDISKEFNEKFSDKLTILTSATLKVNDSFEYIKERLGLKDFSFYSVESPFNYDENMKIYISNNEYNPNSNEFLEYSVSFIEEFLKKHNDGTFILCTSYKQVEYIYENLSMDGYNILKQGNMSRTSLIDNFKTNEKSILIGTDSFWEGVDVKGELLKNVIIVKLPFVAPDDPVIEAISDSITREGKNAFMSYQLPLMIIKLKQGVGRLIRSNEDKGNIVILDNRIYKKRYGKNILNSLPSKTLVRLDD